MFKKLTVLVIAGFYGQTESMTLAEKNRLLYERVEWGDIKKVRELLADGAEVDRPDGWTPLMIAVRNQDIAMVKLLLMSGANPNTKVDCFDNVGCSDSSPLTLALNVKYNSTPILELLHAHGAVLDTRNGDGTTPLMWGIGRGCLHEVRFFLKNGVHANLQDQKGRNALMCAVASHANYHYGLVCPMVQELLLVPSIDLLIKNNKGLSVLDKAKKRSMRLLRKGEPNQFKKAGRMFLAHLRFYSAHGRVAKNGLQQILPLDVLKHMATLIDYESAARVFKG